MRNILKTTGTALAAAVCLTATAPTTTAAAITSVAPAAPIASAAPAAFIAPFAFAAPAAPAAPIASTAPAARAASAASAAPVTFAAPAALAAAAASAARAASAIPAASSAPVAPAVSAASTTVPEPRQIAAGTPPTASANHFGYLGAVSLGLAVLGSVADPDRSPAGANDFGCKPSSAHPYPVVLVHGTFANAFDSWSGLAPVLKNAGYCVFALNYGESKPHALMKATAHVPDSARQLASYVDRVLAATGASKVDLVGHSQGGGLTPEWYLRFDGGAAKVHHLVGINPSNHGTDASGLAPLLDTVLDVAGRAGKPLGLDSPAARDQTIGSSVLQRLYAGGDTEPGVDYTTIVSRTDLVVTPYTNQFLKAGPGAKVHNILLQDRCPLDLTGHAGGVYDPNVNRLVLNALDPAHAEPVRCALMPVPV
ncbi:esterase/lipase family protein [Streptomyces spinosisporus]|uniref:Alpha/beta fold hydrolase n=1 Tax=Streptomyces spinosisporus TaxID=2927582 RepID=A0ABS9XIY0_9ACTN|nr:alpha/beta fold hydrolase [Streptomyces spinosisporus]MCI3242044.1 alpha/beta fold hydrolase [Streptomyces spinosisporus]